MEDIDVNSEEYFFKRKTLSNNKHIAQYMGFYHEGDNEFLLCRTLDDGQIYYPPDKLKDHYPDKFTNNDFKFNKSFDWIMPVVFKINNRNSVEKYMIRKSTFFKIEENRVILKSSIWNSTNPNAENGWWHRFSEEIRVKNNDTEYKIYAIYQLSVEYIHWYNKIKLKFEKQINNNKI